MSWARWTFPVSITQDTVWTVMFIRQPFSSSGLLHTTTRKLNPKASGLFQFHSRAISRFPRRSIHTSVTRRAKLPTRDPTRSQVRLSRQQLYANNLYEEGNTRLYTTPRNVAYTAGAYFFGFGCIGGAIWFFFENFSHQRDTSALPWFVPVSYRLSMIVLSLLGGWIILRSGKQVKTVNLIQESGRVKVLITMRKPFPLPFLRPRQIVSDVNDFVLPRELVLSPSDYQSLTSNPIPEKTGILASISRLFSGFFLNTRRIFTQEGFVIATIKNETGFKLDIRGFEDTTTLDYIFEQEK